MKTKKYILLSLVSFGFAFLTSCSSLQNMPYDDVYYSGDNQGAEPVHQQVTVVNSSPVASANEAYQQGTVEQVNPNAPATTDTVYEDFTDQSAQRYYDDYASNNDCNCDDNSGFSLNLGFGNAFFGSSPWSWNFYGFNTFRPFYSWGYSSWYDPYYYDSYFAYSPVYGWGGYSPYYYYGAYSWMMNPYVYNNNYFYNNYYQDYGYSLNRRSYQVRRNRFGGTNIPRSVTSGSAYASSKVKSARRVSSGKNVSARKRVPVNPAGKNGRAVKSADQSRPSGSMRYQSQLAREKRMNLSRAATVNKKSSTPNRNTSVYRRVNSTRIAGSRSSGSNIRISRTNTGSKSRYQKPVSYKQKKSVSRPRYQKPRQYQSLNSRRSNNPKVYYRTNTRRPVLRPSSSLKTSRPASVNTRNVYRPSRTTTTRHSVYRPVTRQSPRVKVYSRPVRSSSSSNTYSAPSRSYRAPSRTYSAPSRSSSSSSSGSSRSSGSGGVSRTSRTGGGIRR